MPELIQIEIAVATPENQQLIQLKVPQGTTVQAALELGGMVSFVHAQTTFGIWSKPASLDQELQAGDRVELYRPITADPKQARMQRVTER